MNRHHRHHRHGPTPASPDAMTDAVTVHDGWRARPPPPSRQPSPAPTATTRTNTPAMTE